NEGYPVGTVALSGPAGLCTPVLTSTAADTATYTCSISGTALAAGSVTVGATFTPGTPSSSNPDFVYTGTSTTNSAALTVDPEAEPTTTALAISGPAPTYGSENLTATATVTGVAGDGATAGTVTLSGQQCALAV